jgi:hypothetical protein
MNGIQIESKFAERHRRTDMRKLFVLLLTAAFLGSTGLVFAQATATPQATPVVKAGKTCDKSKKECKGKKDGKAKKECIKAKKEATPVAGAAK